MKSEKYICPMHPEITSSKPGNCPKCGMHLVKEGSEVRSHEVAEHDASESYWPLVVIIGFITLVTIALSLKDSSLGNFDQRASMSYFMAGFFLVFSAFKFLDLKGFAMGYSSYDLLASKVFGYGYFYPFIELGLGIIYLLGYQNFEVNLFTALLMGFSGLGVLNSMLKKRKFQCACLGTFLKVPLTKVTLIEDFGMALMALLMLL